MPEREGSKNAANAAKIIKALSRPGTTQKRSASAWSTKRGHRNDKGYFPTDAERGLTQIGNKAGGIDPYLAEELAKEEKRANSSKNEPKGCWDMLSGYIRSVWSVSFYFFGSNLTKNICLMIYKVYLSATL